MEVPFSSDGKWAPGRRPPRPSARLRTHTPTNNKQDAARPQPSEEDEETAEEEAVSSEGEERSGKTWGFGVTV